MKRKIYIALSVLVVGILLWFLLTMHIPYNWKPTFQHNSTQPFGAALFDSLMTQSLPNGYEVEPDLPEHLDPAQNAVLYCKFCLGTYQRGYSNREDEIERGEAIMDFVKRGGHVIVATANINYWSWEEEGEDKLLKAYDLKYKRDRIVRIEDDKIVESYRNLNEAIEASQTESYEDWIDYERHTEYQYALLPLTETLKNRKVDNDTLTWVKDQTDFVLSPLYTAGSQLYNLCSTQHRVLMTYRYNHYHHEVLAFRRQYTKGGSITFVATPLLFSNYAVMDSEALPLTQRILLPLLDKHLIRIEGVNEPDGVKLYANKDEFSFIRRHRSLRYAFYLLLGSLVLAFLNYSRRRMRAIPLLPEEKNVTLDFARFMGTFHYRRHDYKQVVLNQYETMLHLLGETMISDVNRLTTSELKEVIIEKTHLPAADAGMLVRTVYKLQNTEEIINQEDMMKLLDVIRKVKAELGV